MNALVTFRLGRQEYATALADVREVVRMQGLADLPGMAPPLAGVLDLRGAALPVLDLRVAVGDRRAHRGDVLVLQAPQADGGTVGVAVDQVRAVLTAGDLPRAGGDAVGVAGAVLPAYVLDVLRGADGVVFLVDLAAMVDDARGQAAACVG